ncbi:MAG: zinc-binding dehydrogenase [Nitrososphaerales archaeon]
MPKLESGEILARMRMVGICGSDVHMWHNPSTPAPMIFGHENVAEIEALGEGRITDGVGQEVGEADMIVFTGRIPCGRCFICTVANEPTVCENSIAYGMTPNTERPYLRGGYGEYVHLMPRAGIVKITDKKLAEKGMLAVLGNATVSYGLEKAGGVNAGETIVIQGSGPIGLAALVQSKLHSAHKIIMVGAPEGRLNLAKSLGSDEVVNIDENREPADRVKLVYGMTEGRGGDLVIEASGGKTAFDEGLQMTRIGGRYLDLGQATNYGPMLVNPYYITKRALRVFGSWGNTPKHLYKAIIKLQDVDLPMNKLITHRFNIDDATKGLQMAESLSSVISVIEY